MGWLTLRQLRSKDYDTRENAFSEATRNRDIEALLQVIEDADQYIRSNAIKALGEIGDLRAVPALIKRLDDANFNNQEQAAAALAKLGDRRAVHPLVAMLRAPDKHMQARSAAVKAIVALGDASSIPALLDVLCDQDKSSRYLTLEALSVIGDGRCVPAALAALHDPDINVRWEAVKTLGALRDARAVDALIELLARDPHGHGPNCETIIEALGRIGDKRAEPALVALLNGPQGTVRKAAVAALDVLGWQPADDAERVRSCMARERWDELALLSWDRARQILLESLQNRDLAVRQQAVKAIELIGEQHVVELLIPALKDEGVAEAAALVLGKRGDSRVVKPLIEHCVRYSPEGGYRNDPTATIFEQKRADKWVHPLEALVKRLAADLAPEVLRQLAGLNDKTYHLRVDYDTPGYGNGADDFVVTLDFTRVRDSAAKELHRRGLDI
jgi:HEAT repeat protein